MAIEDYILKEINKIGTLLRALMSRLRLSDGDFEEEQRLLREEFREQLAEDFDTLVANPELAEHLQDYHQADAGTLEVMAQLMARLAMKAPDTNTRQRYAQATLTLYDYLDRHHVEPPFERFCILEELHKAGFFINNKHS